MRQFIHLREVTLEVGIQYEVFGVIFREGVPWLYLREEQKSEYPVPHCICFFEIEDPIIPQDWQLLLSNNAWQIVPRWWAEVPNFLERLVGADPDVVAIFERNLAVS